MTPKQQRFVEEYLVDLNATQAAKRAGYSHRAAAKIGFENLQKPEIRKAINAAQNKLAERAEVTQEWVIDKLREVVRRALPDVNPDMDPDERLLLLKMTDLSAATNALDKLGKHTGIYHEDNKQRREKEPASYEDVVSLAAAMGVTEDELFGIADGEPPVIQ